MPVTFVRYYRDILIPKQRATSDMQQSDESSA